MPTSRRHDRILEGHNEASGQTRGIKYKLSSRKEQRPYHFFCFFNDHNNNNDQSKSQKDTPPSPFSTMATTVSTLTLPLYNNQPFFSRTFSCPIAIGSFFLFQMSPDRSKHLLGRIVSAKKAVDDDHVVTVNTFLFFEKWPASSTLYPIKDGLGKNLQEVVLTADTADFHFDRDVYDMAFMFTTDELERRGAILQGINNVFVCRYYEDEKEVQDGELVPFPSMIIGECPVPQCLLARVFIDIETLRSQIYADLNRRGEQQGELAKTFNNVPFAWESWSYLKFKLHRLGIPLQPSTNRYFLHRLTHDMKRTKFAVSEDVEVMRFSDETQFASLRSVLGSTICYGIRASRAKLSDKAPRRIPADCAVNCVVEEPTVAPPKFVRVPPASEGGFDLIHNRKNLLSLRVRYRKFHFQTADGASIPLEECCLPQHFQDILKPLNWGFWNIQPESIKQGDMFDHEHRLYSVTAVFANYIEARHAFTDNPPIAFHDLDAVINAIARKQGIDGVLE
jgi:hypothetical protein